jgi:hypothetical protein
MGWAKPSQPGLVTGPSQWPAGQMTDARVKQFHACINSAKVIKLPSHCSNAYLNTDNEMRIELTCFWRWRRRLQCWWLTLSFDGFPLSTRCAHCLPFFWFLNSWDEEAEKVMGMSVFSEFFYWFRVALFFSAGTKIIAGIILLSVSATLFLSPSLRVCFFFSLCSAFFFLCSSSGFWVYFSPPSVLGFLLPFIDSPTDCL